MSKRGLVVGIANEASIAAGCARAFHGAGAKIAATYVNEKARPFVRAVTDPLDCEILLPCDVRFQDSSMLSSSIFKPNGAD